MSQFRRLVSNMSLSPAVAPQFGYYFRRLARERFSRRLSAGFAALLIGLQIVTVVAPPTASNAASTSDFIYGGVSSPSEAMQVCKANRDRYGHVGIASVFGYFGISCDDLGRTTPGSVNSSDHSLLNLGRTRHSATDEVLVVAGETYYLRPLYVWRDGSSFPALMGHRVADGSAFAVLIECGNIIVNQPPKLTISKAALPNWPAVGTRANPAPIAPGAELGYRLFYSNSGAPATTAAIEDAIPAHTTYVRQGNGSADFASMDSTNSPVVGPVPHAWWVHKILPGGATNYYVDLIVKADATAPNGTLICNTGHIRSDQTPPVTSNEVCQIIKVTIPTPPPPPVIPPPSKIVLTKVAAVIGTGAASDANHATLAGGTQVDYTLTTRNTGGTAEKGYIIKDDISDILEYADVADPHGGTVDLHAGTITWPKVNIPAKPTKTSDPSNEVVKIFRILIKTPVPTTPVSASDPRSFDCLMDNVYGTGISVGVTCATPKQVELVSQKLPQTGAGTDLLVISIFGALSIYFFARNRQLVTEVGILRHDHTGGTR